MPYIFEASMPYIFEVRVMLLVKIPADSSSQRSALGIRQKLLCRYMWSSMCLGHPTYGPRDYVSSTTALLYHEKLA